jgi:predicted TIM-barrel fold metal-dependent hydrolase
MPVIDIDSHFEPAADWLDEFPALNAKLPEKLPTDDPRFRTRPMRSAELFAYFVSDDLLRDVPPEERMPIERIVTPGMEEKYADERGPEVGYPGSDQHQYLTGVRERLAWMDEQGIDIENVISGVGYTMMRAIKDPQLCMEALEAVNTWMTDHLADANGRLLFAANLRYEDLGWAIGELTRMRDRGCRTFLLPAEPTGNIPPNHPAYDRLWSAVTDLGMIPIVHVGLSPVLYHPAWANTDDPAVIRVISTLGHAGLPFLVGMVLGGVFERHPKLTVVFAEHGIDWITPATFRLDALAQPGLSPLLLDRYALPLAPGEYVRRNVRVTPLPVPHESPVGTLELLPEVPIFSSDYPHFEGNNDPVGHYEKELAGAAPQTKASFLGDNLAECFARTGDPIAS